MSHLSTKVRYPADGMAYVFAPVLHPDQHEDVRCMMATRIHAKIFTLLFEHGVWRIHDIGRMLPPAELGKTAYSW